MWQHEWQKKCNILIDFPVLSEQFYHHHIVPYSFQRHLLTIEFGKRRFIQLLYVVWKLKTWVIVNFEIVYVFCIVFTLKLYCYIYTYWLWLAISRNLGIFVKEKQPILRFYFTYFIFILRGIQISTPWT